MRRKSRENPISLFSFQDIITAVTGIILLLVILLSLSLVQLPETTPSSDLTTDSAEELQRELDDLKNKIKRAKTSATSTDVSLAMLPAQQLKQKLSEAKALAEALKKEQSELDKQESEAAQKLEEVFAKIKSNPVFSEIEKLKQQIEQTQSEINRLKQTNKRLYNFRNSRKKPQIIDIHESKILIGTPTQKTATAKFEQASAAARLKAAKDWLTRNANSSAYFVLIVREDSVDTFRAIRTTIESIGCDMGIDLVGNSVTVLEP